jgi:hypothetical protein
MILKDNTRGNGFGYMLRWETPTADNAGPTDKKALMQYLENGHQLVLHKRVLYKELWPTPTASTNDYYGFNTKKVPFKLSGMVKAKEISDNWQDVTLDQLKGFNKNTIPNKWPTPTKSDYKGTGQLGSKSQKHMFDRGRLPATVIESEQVSGHINPDWVEWLMGWPIGWTSVKPLSELIWLDIKHDPYPTIPRVKYKQLNHNGRLKALGNGQVPQCMATAFNLLFNKED